MSERLYSVIEDGQKIVKALTERYPEVLWQVRPNQIVVLGIENKEPTKKSKDFRVRSVKNAEKAVLEMHKIQTRFIVELWWSRWNEWSVPRREWTILEALLRVSVDEGKLISPDCSDFKIVLDKVSFDWDSNGASLPSLTEGIPVAFDLDLRPGKEDDEEENEEEEE